MSQKTTTQHTFNALYWDMRFMLLVMCLDMFISSESTSAWMVSRYLGVRVSPFLFSKTLSIDPLHIVGMQPIWGAKQMKFSLLGIEILLFCPPDWLHSHRRAEKVVQSSEWPVISHLLAFPSGDHVVGSAFALSQTTLNTVQQEWFTVELNNAAEWNVH